MSIDASKVGPPDVALAGFQLWVHGYEFPRATDDWDANWLRVSAHCGAQGASVWAGGPIVSARDLASFARELQALYDRLEGAATLPTIEPNLAIRVHAVGRGALEMRVEITPDHLAQAHSFTFELDQTYLPATIAALEAVLARYPVRGLASEPTRP